jgi:hypothetical protein
LGIKERIDDEKMDEPNYEYSNDSSTYYNSPGNSEHYIGYDVLKGAKKHHYKAPENKFTDISKEKNS